MAKSRLSSNSDLDNQFENLMDFRHDKRFNNINYVRHLLRKFFGNYTKKFLSITQINDDNLISPILIQPCLHFDKHTKFCGKRKVQVIKIK